MITFWIITARYIQIDLEGLVAVGGLSELMEHAR